MVGLLFPQQSHWRFPVLSPVQLQADEIMILRSSVWSPTLNRMIGFASAKRDYRMPGQSLDVSINGESCQVTVCATTFYEPEPVHKRAQRLYQEALQLYAGESDTSTQSRAVELLRWALDLDPVLEDAYEALGVILSKRGQLDEAITLMRQLAELNPDSVMAHTNLSVFYLDKGLKEQAEEEKAISMSIRMRIAAQQVAAQKEEAKKKTQDLEEAKQRMDMFKQVLEIDADDLLANYGVGSCYVSLGEFAQSVPFLKKAIQIKPAHTVAYISLGEAYEGLGDIAAAMAIYEKGIDVATKRGDMTPMHEMQNRLSTLKAAQQKEKV
jgi:tetratricopeptide (TPR) repeat protein